MTASEYSSETPFDPSRFKDADLHPFTFWISRLAFIVAFLSQIIVAWRFWGITWDDSAITLGFSRTFALTGHIEPTPGSGIVEGYSTTLWMLLMALAAKFVGTPAALLAVAKISTLILNLINLLLIRYWFSNWTSETLGNLIAGSVGCGLMFYETINGMETPIIMTLVLVMLILHSRTGTLNRLLYLIAGSALILTRWEAAWLLIPFVLIEPSRRRSLNSSIIWMAVFIIENLVRLRYFGQILPNTIIAKHGIPYSNLNLRPHLKEPLLILASIKVMAVIMIAVHLYTRRHTTRQGLFLQRFLQPLRNSWQLRICLIFTLSSLVLSTAIGQNWGPPFRSFYSAWPFLIALPLIAAFSNLRLPVLPLITFCLCFASFSRLYAQVQDLRSPIAPVYMPNMTIDTVADTASILAEIQSISGHSNLVFAGPDMGGVILFTHDIKVIDLGLLCDSVLAHQRFAAIGTYVLQERHPDIIEVHGMWTIFTNFQSYPLFLARYRPVYLHGHRFFLDKSLIANIDPSRIIEKSFDSDGLAAEDQMQSQQGVLDYKLNQLFGSYLVLH